MIGILYNEFNRPSRCSLNFEYLYTKAGHPRATMCSIHVHIGSAGEFHNSDKIAIMHGLSFCNSEDTFTKKRGKELALARVVENFPKYVQAQIWRIYRGK